MDGVTDAGVEALADRGCGSNLTTLSLEGLRLLSCCFSIVLSFSAECAMDGSGDDVVVSQEWTE